MANVAARPKMPAPVELSPSATTARQFAISSTWLRSDDSRFDASTYAREGFAAERALRACKCKIDSFGSLCGTIWHPVQNQARSNFKRIYTRSDYGVPFVGSRHMFFFPMRPERFLSKLMKKLQDLMVPRGWLLLSRSGTVGNVLYVNDTLAKCAITDHAIRIEPKGDIAGYLYVVLASKFGQAIIEQGSYGSTVEELEPKHIASIPVPRFPQHVQQGLHDKIIRAYEIRDQANALYDEAERELYRLLNLAPFSEDDIKFLGKGGEPRAFSVASGALLNRFDAAHHVPVTAAVIEKLKATGYSLVRVADIVDRVYVAPRFARVYVEGPYGTPLLQGSQLPLARPYGLKCISNAETIKMDRWIIRPGWVLVTCSGTIGRVAVSSKAQDGWAASQHILRIIPREGVSHPGFLALFLATPYGQHQLKAKVYGGVVDELTEHDTAMVMIPAVTFAQQQEIGAKVARVYELRDEASEIEAQAIQEFETRVERSYSENFYSALASLDAHGITSLHARAARSQWYLLCSRYVLREPIVQITCEGAVQFAWNRGRYYFEIEVWADGRLSWFFRDRDNDVAEGTDGEPERVLSATFWARLALAGRAA